jgi:hypothetical protein
MTFKELLRTHPLTNLHFLAYWKNELEYWKKLPMNGRLDIHYQSDGTRSVNRLERISHCQMQIELQELEIAAEKAKLKLLAVKDEMLERENNANL